MLKVQRLRILIQTEQGKYGFDHNFNAGLNIIASDNNTSGKSTIINGLYYALGFEQLIESGGTGSKTLSQALTKQIRIDDNIKGAELPVLESEIQTELFNGNEVITVRRYAKNEKKKDNLVTVFYSSISDMYSKDAKFEDMYVHMPGSAQRERGFHRYFEEYLDLDLPEVTATNGLESKLYLQTIVSAFFIEQKHGWSGFLNGVPYLGIAEVKKRIVEYILGLSSLESEKARKRQKREEDAIIDEWKKVCFEIEQIAKGAGINIEKMPQLPILSHVEIAAIVISKEGKSVDENLSVRRELSESLISVESRIYTTMRPKIEEELQAVQKDIADKQVVLEKMRETQRLAKIRLSRSVASLEIVKTDLTNNKEARRLRDLGSQQGIKDFDHLCPTCGQGLNDSLLNDKTVMSLVENIAHLENQETLFKFSVHGQQKSLTEIEIGIEEIERMINNLRKLQSVLSNDLVKVKGDYSSAKAYQKVQVDAEISRIENANGQINALKGKFIILIERWAKTLSDKSKLGNRGLSEADSRTLFELGTVFSGLLKDFGYRSTTHFESIKISHDTFLPTINGFDMKYDSSASDELRNIWAFTLALLDVSADNKGNHPRILIYDEPKQQSVVDESFKMLCEKLIAVKDDTQIIIGVTAFDDGVKRVIAELDKEKYSLVNIGNRAFKKLDEK